MEFDHYEALVKKLKDINCFYNEIYQDWKDWKLMDIKADSEYHRNFTFEWWLEK
jgi:hypothetical protein